MKGYYKKIILKIYRKILIKILVNNNIDINNIIIYSNKIKILFNNIDINNIINYKD